MATAIRRPRVASPERWQRALERAIAGNVQVRQLSGSGAWIATSATDPSVAYEVEISNGVVHGCSCLAGLNGDAVCAHQAAAWHLLGVLELDDPDPTPPTPLVWSGRDRVVTVVERKRQPGTFDIIDYARKQKLGGGGSFDFIINRLHEGGFVPVPTATAA